MNNKIVIKDVAIYHPEKTLKNDYFIKHFKEQGNDITRLLNAIGRESRYIGNEEETSLTMATKASVKVLEKANLSGEDLDMIVFASASPEYLAPPNSVMIHQAINGKMDTMTFDMNAGCVGMVMAVDQVCRTMMTNPYLKRALVVGSDQFFKYAREDEAPAYASFGDAAAAIILEKQDETESGFIDSLAYTVSEHANSVVFPASGLSNIYKEDIEKRDKLLKWESAAGSSVSQAISAISNLLNRNSLDIDEVKLFCLSQISKKNIIQIQEGLDQPLDKFVMVGEEFGYTTVSSPFVALDRAISGGKITKGDYVVFWSVGAGQTASAMLFKY